jgi:hypothetical protein
MFRRLAVALLVVSVSSRLEAQVPRKGIAEFQPSLRGGFWGSIGFGAGMENVDLDGDAFGYSDALWRPTFNFRLGGTVKQVLRLGGEVNVWTNYSGSITETLVTLMPIIQVYPIRSAGLNFRGGVGYAWSSVTDNYYYYVSSGNNGFSTLLGVGWEFPVSSKFFITPGVDWYQEWYGGGYYPDGYFPGYTERVINFSISIGLQGG